MTIRTTAIPEHRSAVGATQADTARRAFRVGTVAELPYLSWLAPDRAEAFEGIQRLAAEVVEDMRESGETPPAALADREYSGRFVVRIPPEAHRRLAVEVAEQNVSLNRLVATRLSRA